MASDLMTSNDAAVKKCKHCLTQYWESEATIRNFGDKWGFNWGSTMATMKDQLRRMLVINTVMQDACTTHYGVVQGTSYLKKPLENCGERHVLDASRYCSEVNLKAGLQGVKEHLSDDLKAHYQRGLDEAEKFKQSVIDNKQSPQHLDGHEDNQLQPVPDNKILTCGSPHQKGNMCCPTVKSINISNKCVTDVDILRGGIINPTFLQHQMSLYKPALMAKHSTTHNQLIQGNLVQPSLELLQGVPIACAGSLNAQNQVTDLKGMVMIEQCFR